MFDDEHHQSDFFLSLSLCLSFFSFAWWGNQCRRRTSSRSNADRPHQRCIVVVVLLSSFFGFSDHEKNNIFSSRSSSMCWNFDENDANYLSPMGEYDQTCTCFGRQEDQIHLLFLIIIVLIDPQERVEMTPWPQKDMFQLKLSLLVCFRSVFPCGCCISIKFVCCWLCQSLRQ